MNTGCIVDGSWGIYVPQCFAERFSMDKWHVTPEDADILMAGPDHEYYWDAWDDVLNNAYFITDDDRTLMLYQDGDLFAYDHDEDSE